MEHFIVIIFNLQFEGKPITYEGNPCWLENRLSIFKKYCINAFAKQTDPNFHLLLYCDNTTPEPYKSELLELENKYNFIHLCWDFSIRGDMNFLKTQFKSSVLDTIKKLSPKGTQEVICSRFENDDIPDIRYNEVVKEVLKTQRIISLGKGLYWDLNTNKWKLSFFPHGPFVSVKSTLDNFMSPLEDEHTKYYRYEGFQPIDSDEPLWIQLIHGENLWNELDKMPGTPISPVNDEYLKTYFGYE